jgi:hypothetical protein
MITSTTKLIATLTVLAAMLATSSAFAKGGSGKSGGSGSSNHSQNHISSALNSFKLGSSSSNSSSHTISINNISTISKKPVSISQTFSKKDLVKDHKNSTVSISLNSINSMKHDQHKDIFCKKDNKCWFDSCYSKSCNPFYFGCYYPIYDCYDYCTPTYTTCTYTISEPVQPVEFDRTLVPVGSILMINGQTFGDQPGGARLRINGMAMPIATLAWTSAGVQVQLPQIELTGVTPADIEVIRADGSVASTSPIDLTGMTEQVATDR